MMKAGCSVRRRRAAFAFPCVKSDVVEIPAGGRKYGLRTETLGDGETENIAIEGECAFEIGQFEVDVADTHAAIDRIVRKRCRGEAGPKRQE